MRGGSFHRVFFCPGEALKRHISGGNHTKSGKPYSRKPFSFDRTVHKDISERLPQFNRPLYLQVKEVLDVNKAQRHIRGGIATRKKYRGG